MRVLWFTNTPSLATQQITGQSGIGGGWIESLERHLGSRKDVELGVAFRWKTSRVSHFALEPGGVTYYQLPQYPFGKWARLMGRLRTQIEPEQEIDDFLEVIEDFQPDVINIFGSEQGFGRIIPRTDIPVIIWIQGNMTVYTHKWFSGIRPWQVILGTPFVELLKGNSQLHDYFQAIKIAKRERDFFAQARHLSGRTDWDRRLTATLAPKARYHHCDEVMRPAFYTRAWTAHNSREKTVLLTTIRTNIYKGLETLFRTAALLNSLIGDRFIWRVAGIAPQDVLVRVTQRALRFDYRDLPVELLGNRTSEQLIDELIYTDLFVHPSHIDNSPNSVCEAMLMGVPVVATNAGGIPSLINNHKDGLLVQDGDPWALAGAILELVRDPEKAAALGQKARERGLVRNDPEKICNDLVGIYQKLLYQSASIPV